MGPSPTYVLGVNAYDHDVSAALLRDGAVVVAVSKERITRVKHDTGFYADPVAYCLLAEGITLDDVAVVVRNSYLLPVGELERQLRTRADSRLFTPEDRARAERSVLFGAGPPKVVDVSHHLAHAYAAFACSPFERGAVMVVDGVGSLRADVLEDVPPHCEAPPQARESESWYAFEGKRLRTVRKIWMPPPRGLVNDDFLTMEGLGALYSRVSSYVFGHWNRCGEVMGLAPYGRPGLAPLAWLEGEELRMRPWDDAMAHPCEGLGDEAWARSPHRRHWEDLARRMQEDTEEVLLGRARHLHREVGAPALALAGGVALNCVANGRLREEGPFEEVFVQPAAGDDGIALGCALYGWLEVLGRERTWVLRDAALGMPYGEEHLRAAVAAAPARLGCARSRPADVVEAVADLLTAGRVVGWFQGGSEFGPRALGRRSILADPRRTSMRDHVNAHVKHRQAFRPFAPAIPREDAGAWFEGLRDSPFMLQAARVRSGKRERIPAVVHVDGSARVQTVERATNPRFHALLRAFERRTGVPVLLNTSFNDRGEPLVETPGDALATFLATELDALALGDHLLRKRALPRALRPLLRRWARLRQRVGRRALRRAAARRVLQEEGEPPPVRGPADHVTARRRAAAPPRPGR
jgi:carbamoyltransferase